MSDLTTIRNRVFDMEQHTLQMPQVTIPVKHHFGTGTYAREIFIPAGTTMTGAIQKFSNVNILSQGDITVLTKDGMMRVQAPWTEVTPAGTKRVGYAHTDCVWTTIFATDETDPDKAVELFTTNSEPEYLAHVEQLKLEGN